MADSSSLKDECSTKSTQDQNCIHPVLYKNICTNCSKDVCNSVSTIQISYIKRNLRLSTLAMDQIRKTLYKSLLDKKRLCLILDLDYTLIHTVQKSELSPNEMYLTSEAEQNKPEGNIFMYQVAPNVPSYWITKLRPYVREFLIEANKMFQLFVYTMGSRAYALEIAEILDPKNEYFKGRVISRNDSTDEDEKSLDVVMAPESLVVILDDSESVWEKHRGNLIVMEKYMYFSGCHNPNSSTSQSLAELKKDESETDGALARTLKDLSRIHQMFFDSELDTGDNPKDVRHVLWEHYSSSEFIALDCNK